MKRIVHASIALLAPLALLACDHRSSDPAEVGELAQSDPGATPDPGDPDPGVPSPQPGTGLYDAGLAPTPGTSPAPTDRSIGPSETPTMPSNPGTDPGSGYPAPPGDNPDDNTDNGTGP